MLTIHIHNDGTGTDDSANYTFDVLVNGSKVDGGVITGHNRKDDWRSLLQRMINQHGTKTCAWCGKELHAASDHIATYGDGRSMHYSCSLMYDQKVADEMFGLKRMTQAEWDALHDETFFEIMENTK